mmetsp:Transcript_16250/g.51672  ORF Transcript_16250/g.51672 Transcript_16250/m.51672 type:complete len:211 (+) Transcript_16250:828-1460(+)
MGSAAVPPSLAGGDSFPRQCGRRARPRPHRPAPARRCHAECKPPSGAARVDGGVLGGARLQVRARAGPDGSRGKRGVGWGMGFRPVRCGGRGGRPSFEGHRRRSDPCRSSVLVSCGSSVSTGSPRPAAEWRGRRHASAGACGGARCVRGCTRLRPSLCRLQADRAAHAGPLLRRRQVARGIVPEKRGSGVGCVPGSGRNVAQEALRGRHG